MERPTLAAVLIGRWGTQLTGLDDLPPPLASVSPTAPPSREGGRGGLPRSTSDVAGLLAGAGGAAALNQEAGDEEGEYHTVNVAWLMGGGAANVSSR
eukprot:1179480-Prorocentrum_minimum.AAC.3